MDYTAPEKKGISSKKIQEYIEVLEKNRLSTHDLIVARGDSIVFEAYWEPFHSDFLHRMYSVSKSFVSIAVGFLEQDKKLSLDDPISKYFEEELKKQQDANMRNQTIRHMLMMCTAKLERNWFTARTSDRVRFYLENDTKQSRPSGTVFQYDSTGSFILCALVERISGMPFMEYLRVKLFDKIGVSKEAYCLKCPGGHSWGDSGVLCKPSDLLKIARFVMNKGRWNGEQILNERYISEATAKQVDNNFWDEDEFDTKGYGYQIWRAGENAWLFNGMGCQFALGIPDQDLIMVYNGDNQGKETAKKIIIDSFFDLIVNTAEDEAIEGGEEAYAHLRSYCEGLTLQAASGSRQSDWMSRVDNVAYRMDDNPMGITRLQLSFHGEEGCLKYTNGQGDKELHFGMSRNVYGMFPQEGYSDGVGSVCAPGNFYRCAASGAWVEPHKLYIKVQVIDRYFGILNMFFSFRDNLVGVYMNKSAEDFLNEYVGYAGGIAEA